MSVVSEPARKFSSRSMFILGLIAAAGAVQGCTSTDLQTSSYIPNGSLPDMRLNTSRSAEIYRGTSDYESFKARDRAYALRAQPEQFKYSEIYAAAVDDGIAIPAFNYSKMSKRFLRQQVRFFGPERPGTIVVDARNRYLYLVQPNGMAMRYGIAVGKEGFGWTGSAVLQWKQKWPTWTPPAEMIARKPELAKYAEGLKGSTKNPLGARAMYLFKDGKDTLYRIHGTDKPHTIGLAASSGCFRMINQDVIDLYSRVTNKSSVLVRQQVLASDFENGR